MQSLASKLLFRLLSLFFGYLGVDYFYLGYAWWGVLKLFTERFPPAGPSHVA